MFRRCSPCALWLLLLALAACASTPPLSAARSHAHTVTPSATSTATEIPPPSPTPPLGFVWYTSADRTFHIAYPAGWQVTMTPGTPATVAFTGPGQNFVVSELGQNPGGTPGEIANTYCQTWQGDVAENPVQTSDVTIAGQDWTRANCDAGVSRPAVVLIVEVVSYQGACYQMDYSSPIVEFASDEATYYAQMEQSFRFLP